MLVLREVSPPVDGRDCSVLDALCDEIDDLVRCVRGTEAGSTEVLEVSSFTRGCSNVVRACSDDPIVGVASVTGVSGFGVTESNGELDLRLSASFAADVCIPSAVPEEVVPAGSWIAIGSGGGVPVDSALLDFTSSPCLPTFSKLRDSTVVDSSEPIIVGGVQSTLDSGGDDSPKPPGMENDLPSSSSSSISDGLCDSTAASKSGAVDAADVVFAVDSDCGAVGSSSRFGDLSSLALALSSDDVLGSTLVVSR